MPVMPRPSSKAAKIAFNLIGKPANMSKQAKKESNADKRIAFENSSKVR